MKRINTLIKDCFIIEPRIFKDHRGFFYETFNQNEFNKIANQEVRFVQDNESSSDKGVVRGLHFQIGAYAQAKLIRVVKGKILDVVVDLRPNSPTFKMHIDVEISEENKKQLFVPRGFAHGFVALEQNTIVNYKCDNFYNKNFERGIRYDDKDLNINWKVPKDKMILSEKDHALPTLLEYLNEN